MKYIFFLIITFLSLHAKEDNKRFLFSHIDNSACNIEFKEIVIETLQNHPSIKISKDILKSSQSQADTAFWEFFPTPSVEYSYKSEDRKILTAKLQQPIWDGGKILARYKKALSNKSGSIFALQESKYLLLNDLINSLKEYLQSREKIKVLNINKKQFLKLSKKLQRMKKAGILSNADKNLLDARIIDISSELLIASSKFKVAKTQFEIFIGHPLNCQISYQFQNIFDEKLDINTLLENLSSHPSIKIIDEEINASLNDIKEARSELWPNLTLVAEYRDGKLYEESTEIEEESLAYVTFQASTGAGLSALTNIEKMKIDTSKIRYEKNSKEKEITDEIMNDYINYMTAISQLKSLTNDLKIAQDIYETNQRLFLSQKKSWLDVVNSLSEVSKLNIQYQNLKIEKNILELYLALKSGKLDLDNFEVIK